MILAQQAEQQPLDDNQRANLSKLVDSLRSGNYGQTIGRLMRNDGDGAKYCCLGVACEEFRLLSGQGYWNGRDFVTPDNRKDECILVPMVSQFYGFTQD